MSRTHHRFIYPCLMTVIAIGLSLCTASVAQTQDERGADLKMDGKSRVIQVTVGQSRIAQAPWRIKRVSVGDPAVADVQVFEVNKVRVLGKMAGRTDLVVWSDTETIWRAALIVGVDLEPLQRELAREFPESNIRIRHVQSVASAMSDPEQPGGAAAIAGPGKPTGALYIVTGTFTRAEQAGRLHRMLDAAGLAGQYADFTQVAGLQQVQIHVRIAEVSRNAIRALGVNAIKGGDDFFGASLIGPSSGGALNPVSIGPAEDTVASMNSIPFPFTSDVTVSPLVTLLAGFPNSDLEFFIQALAENQYLRVLAEPNLVSLSGEEANFLAGGEYPIPIVQGTTGGSTSISIEYKEYGIRLRFLPTVMGDGKIRIRIAPEVSQLSDVGAVELQGFRIPSLVTRRAEASLEMASGQTFAMAGLLSTHTNARSSRIPWLGDVPVMGSLFRSVRYEKGETEMLVLVKATLVEPLSLEKNPPVPGEGDQAPNDWELFGLGRIHGQQAAILSPEESQWLKSKGLDRLEGPGAWATYEQTVAPSRAPLEDTTARNVPPAVPPKS